MRTDELRFENASTSASFSAFIGHYLWPHSPLSSRQIQPRFRCLYLVSRCLSYSRETGASVLLCLAFSMSTCALRCRGAEPVQIGSKVFTESVILGELATQLGREAGVNTLHRSQLGGSPVLWKALLNKDIDAYSEYTGTIAQELLPGTPMNDLVIALAKHGVGMTRSLGFEDTYAIGMPEALAARLNVKSIDDLRDHAELRLGLSNEFLNRKDGWPAVRTAYQLDLQNVTGLDHDLAYRAISSGKTELIDLYSTDAEIAFYHLRTLDDDRHVFPEYKAVYLYRLDLQQRAPAFITAIQRLEGAIDARQMIAMNASSKLDKIPESRVASSFLLSHLKTKTDTRESGWFISLIVLTREHLFLVAISLTASIIVAVPLGVLAFDSPKIGFVILATVSAIYTIPSLALLVFMIPIMGIGTAPAIVALFLYGLLPIVRNTHAGLAGIPQGLRESASVLGLSPTARLLRVELPMAAPSILAGIKTAAVINVGTATLGALIGAGGYGQPILTGIRLADNRTILFGAIPAAVLALLVQGSFGLLERLLLPRGLRLKSRG